MNLFLVAALASTQQACPPKNAPVFLKKIYAGSTQDQAVERKQSVPPEVISTKDPKFDDMLCMPSASIACLYSTFVLHCTVYDGIQEPCALSP